MSRKAHNINCIALGICTVVVFTLGMANAKWEGTHHDMWSVEAVTQSGVKCVLATNSITCNWEKFNSESSDEWLGTRTKWTRETTTPSGVECVLAVNDITCNWEKFNKE